MRVARMETIAVVCLALASGCASPGKDDKARDFEVFMEDGSLEEVELSDDALPTLTRAFDRERIGARFAWGSEVSRGYFHVFSEDWLNPPNSKVMYEVNGVGGGAMGAPVVGGSDGEVQFIIPWRADLSIAVGSSTSNVADADLVFAELHGDVGFGLDWKGLRPSAGLALSSISGVIVLDNDAFDDVGIEGLNSGVFFDLKYKHPEYAAYAHLRVLSGDYDSTVLGVGFKF
ncbi:MAG: hypothetical protein ACI9F9_001978 [Candidatus Paceibacteria bacterium]|jgi:hypothetical protein